MMSWLLNYLNQCFGDHRSYFKCAQDGCTVKKHTQQQSKSEVMFTYEGKHNHDAPKL